MLLSEFLCLDSLLAPTHLWFYVSTLKAVFLSSYSGITTDIPQESAACAFITRDQRLGSSRCLSAHRTHRTRATQQSYSAQPGVVRDFRLGTYSSANRQGQAMGCSCNKRVRAVVVKGIAEPIYRTHNATAAKTPLDILSPDTEDTCIPASCKFAESLQHLIARTQKLTFAA